MQTRVNDEWRMANAPLIARRAAPLFETRQNELLVRFGPRRHAAPRHLKITDSRTLRVRNI